MIDEKSWWDGAVRDSDRRAADERAKAAAVVAEASKRKIGRNEPCPCRSGRKWKRCCGARVQA